MTCGPGHTIDLDDLRGRVLHIVAVAGEEGIAPEAASDANTTTILLASKHLARPDPGICVAREPETWTAFAILSGVASETLPGEQLLADQNAWLRATWRPGDPGDWTNPDALAVVIRDIAAHPIAADAAGTHVHRH